MKPSRTLAVSSLVAALMGVVAVTSHAQTVRTLRWAAIGDYTTNWIPGLSSRLPADSLRTFRGDGATTLRSGDSSYWASGLLAQVFAYEPDIVSIQLGSSDSKAMNWDDSANFTADYKALIDTLAAMPSKPRILVVYPTPVMPDAAPTDPLERNNQVISNSIIPRLRAIALEKGADTINLYTPLAGQIDRYLTPNGNPKRILPNSVGQDTLGRLAFRAFVDQSIRIMCVGNSITQAAGTTGGVTVKDAYALRLNMLLGPRYWVWNGGKSGWWMQRAQLPNAGASFKSYVTDKNQMDTLFMMKPHFITVKLGTNDARKYFWQGPRFVNDYRYFIDTLYNNMTPKPKFVLFKAFPAWKVNGNWAFPNNGWTADTSGINGDIIRDSLGPAIDAIASSRPTQVAGVIDLHTPFLNLQSLAPDGVHPNRVGQDSIARKVHRALQPLIATSIAPGVSRASVRPASGAARFIHLAGGRAPEWVRGARVVTAAGKPVRVSADGMLPAGIYFVKPAAASAASAPSAVKP